MSAKLDKYKQSILYISLHAKEIFNRLRWPHGVVYTEDDFNRLNMLKEMHL